MTTFDHAEYQDRTIRLAGEYSEKFTRITRDDGSKIWVVKPEHRGEDPEGNDKPATALVYECHGNGATLPDDYIYEYVVEALDMIHEAGEDEDLDDRAYEIEGDVYTKDLTDWLGSGNSRTSYMDEVLMQTQGEGLTSEELMRDAQAAEKREVYEKVLSHLREVAEEEWLEAEDEEEEEEVT